MAISDIPMSYDDPIFAGTTNSAWVTLQNGGSLSYKSFSGMTNGNPAVTGLGSFSLDHIRMDVREGVRIAGDGNMTISNSWLEITGIGDDHADAIQAYAPFDSGNVTITNTAIVAQDGVGMFVADNYSGTFTFNNVMFWSPEGSAGSVCALTQTVRAIFTCP